MANPLIADLQTMFRKYAGDESITTANIAYYLKDPYNDFAKTIWDTNIKGMVPLVIEKKSVVVDNDKGPYIQLLNTTVVWRLISNQQTAFVDDGTNYTIYMVRGYTDQIVEYVPTQALPVTVTPAVYQENICRIIVMTAVSVYYQDAKEYEEEARMNGRIDKAMADLREGFKQEFIYSENDNNEEITINLG